jgi:peptidoglycan/xylan/chitin deacetylase (PgdA/CDA1 family)
MSKGKARGLIGLTFDDGYEDFLQIALPVLERLGFSATVFVPAGLLGEENSWVQEPRIKLLSASAIRTVTERGMEVGSHGLSHADLSGGLPSVLIDKEIVESYKILTELLTKEVKGFCYPYGNVNDKVAQAVQQANYTYACGGFAVGGVGRSIYNLPRIFVSDRDTPLRLSMKVYAHLLYSKIGDTWAGRIAYILLRKGVSKFWFS